jgi:thiosulfate/3-mercaptopyruvate sulfurtransferase
MVVPVVQGLLLLVGPAVVRGLMSSMGGGSDRRVRSRTPTTARWMTSTSRSSTTRISIAEAIARADELSFIDASWYHKGDRNGHDEYLRGPRIAKSVYFDLSSNNHGGDDHKADHNNKKNGQPTATQFAHIMDRFGITNKAQIVVYGQQGAFFTPRVWFTIRHLMGHEQCHLLDGNMADWEAANGPMEYHILHQQENEATGENAANAAAPTSNYQPQYNPDVLIALPEMKQFVAAKRGLLWDARGSSFTTQGHMPGAVHVPYSSLHDTNGRLLAKEQIEARLSTLYQVDDTTTDDMVVTCGSGVSACTLFWAWHELGWDRTRRRVRVYDGSWSEWKRQDDVPKVIPAAAMPTATSAS